MPVAIVTYSGQTVTSQDDALVYESALGTGGIIHGATVTIKSSNVLHIAAGHGVLCGRKFTITEGDITVQLPTSGTQNGRLYLHLDLSNTSNPISLLTQVATTLTNPTQQSNINITNGVYEINIATFNVSASTISGISMVAPIIAPGAPGFIAPIENGTTASKAYSKGQYLLFKGVLYRAKSAIASGATLTVGTNIEAVKLSDELYGVDTKLNGFGFGVNSSGKAGYILPGTTAIVPFKQASGTATAAQVLTGYTFSNDTVQGADGSMPNRGSVTLKPTGNNTVSGQAGYYSAITADGTASYAAGVASVKTARTLTVPTTRGTAVDITDNWYTLVNNTACYDAGVAAGITQQRAKTPVFQGAADCTRKYEGGAWQGNYFNLLYTATADCIAIISMSSSNGGYVTTHGSTNATYLGGGGSMTSIAVYKMTAGQVVGVYGTVSAEAYQTASGAILTIT